MLPSFPKKKRVLCLSYLKSVDTEAKEKYFKKNQRTEFLKKYEESKKMIPLFVGSIDGDFRDENVYKNLDGCNLYPKFPSDDQFGHIVYDEMQYLYFPSNMYELVERMSVDKVNTFPLSESDIISSYIHHGTVLAKLLSLELLEIGQVQDFSILEKLIKNYERKSKHHSGDNEMRTFKNMIKNKKSKKYTTNKHFEGYTDRRRTISSRTKVLMYQFWKEGNSYQDVSKKFGVPVNSLRVMMRRVDISGVEALQLSKKLNKSIYTDAYYRSIVRCAVDELYPNNSVAAIKNYLREEYCTSDLSESTILRIVHELNYSYKSRNEIKRYTNAPKTKYIRRQFAAKMLNYMRHDYEIIFFDESPISSQCHVRKCWGQVGRTNYFEKEYNSKRGSLLMSSCRFGPLPILIHDGYTNVFVVWAYLRYVLNYMRNFYDTPGSNTVLVMDPHSCHLERFMLQGLVDEFDLFRVAITPEHSPSMCAQELLNRFMKAEVAKMDLDHTETYWKNWFDAYKSIGKIYYLYSFHWFASNCRKSLDDEDLY